MNIFQVMLGQRLKASTVIPGIYAPTDAIKAIRSAAAVFVLDADGTEHLAVLFGPADDVASVAQAKAFAASVEARALYKGRQLVAGTVAGRSIDWQPEMVAFTGKPSAHMEEGGESGPVLGILLDFDGNGRVPGAGRL